MKVLSLFPSLDPAGGGIQTGGVGLTLASSRAGVEHVVACAERPGSRTRVRQLVEPLRERGIPVVSFDPVKRPAQLADRWSISLAQVPWIWRASGGFDAIHVHGVWNIGALSGLAAARRRHIPLVVTSHESLTANDIDNSRSSARRLQKLALKSFYLRWADLFVLTSRLETTESLPRDAPRETIPYPLFDPRRTPPRRRELGSDATLRVGYLGRIAPKKNVPVLIRALGDLPGHVRLLVAGDGPSELVQLARREAAIRRVSDRVQWLGFVPPDERARFLERIDLLVMPSSYESFGMAGAEAMLAGVPLVVSHRTGIAELIRRHGGGAIVDPTADAVAEAIAELDRDRARLAALGAEAQAAVCRDLDYDRVGQQLREAYRRAVLARRDGRR